MEQASKKKWNWIDILDRFRVFIILIIICAIASMLSDDFFTNQNIFNVMRQVSVVAIIGAGMTIVILIAGIDLSVGSVMAFSSAILAGVLTSGMSLPVAMLAAILVGTFFGLINGFLTTKGAVPAFIATLAMMVIARGLTLVYTEGYPITVNNDFLSYIGVGRIAGIPVPVIIMILVFALFYWILNHTTFGRYIYAIGGNEEASRLAGIPVTRIKISVYMIAGLLTGLSAIIYTSRLMSAQPNAGTGLELDAIAAVIIGGTSLMGGKGGVIGTLFGALIMGVLDNILNLLNVSPFYQNVVKGLVIIFAVLLDSRISKIKRSN